VTCLGDDALLAHAFDVHGLAVHVVDLVRTGVVEVFALEQDACSARVLGEVPGLTEWTGSAGVVAQQFVELGLELRVLAGLVPFGVDLVEGGDEGLGGEAPSEVAVVPEFVGPGSVVAHGLVSPEDVAGGGHPVWCRGSARTDRAGCRLSWAARGCAGNRRGPGARGRFPRWSGAGRVPSWVRRGLRRRLTCGCVRGTRPRAIGGPDGRCGGLAWVPRASVPVAQGRVGSGGDQVGNGLSRVAPAYQALTHEHGSGPGSGVGQQVVRAADPGFGDLDDVAGDERGQA